MKLEDFELSSEQKKLCKKIAAAINEARRKGLSIYGKADGLYAYKSSAMKYAAEFHKDEFDYNNPIPCEDCGKINDSGADDAEYFKTGVITK